jgi:hypothetical protein
LAVTHSGVRKLALISNFATGDIHVTKHISPRSQRD